MPQRLNFEQRGIGGVRAALARDLVEAPLRLE